MSVATFLQNVTGLTETRVIHGLLWVSAALFIVLIVAIAKLFGEMSKTIRKRIFRGRQLMTENEREFFGRLQRALPDYAVFPQVAMAGLIDTTLSREHPDFWKVRNQFAKKICDFVISTKTGAQVVVVVELDDCTHDLNKDARRDAMLRQAGIKTVRFDSRAKPDEASIRRLILAA